MILCIKFILPRSGWPVLVRIVGPHFSRCASPPRRFRPRQGFEQGCMRIDVNRPQHVSDALKAVHRTGIRGQGPTPEQNEGSGSNGEDEVNLAQRYPLPCAFVPDFQKVARIIIRVVVNLDRWPLATGGSPRVPGIATGDDEEPPIVVCIQTPPFTMPVITMYVH